MVMPGHGLVMLIPIGAVVTASKSGKGKVTQLEIFTNAKEIEKLHPAFKGIKKIFDGNYEKKLNGSGAKDGQAAVMAKKTVVIEQTHRAFMIKKDKKATKQLVAVGALAQPLKIGWYYWLEPVKRKKK